MSFHGLAQELAVGAALVVTGAVLVIGLLAIVGRRSRLHLVALSWGIDWQARPDLQQRLAELTSGKGPRRVERTRLLRETFRALLRAYGAWLYAHASFERIYSYDTEARIRALARRRELIRDEGGGFIWVHAPVDPPQATIGLGVMVVTVIVVSRQGMPVRRSAPDMAFMRQAIGYYGALRMDDIASVEVVRCPAAEEERMSTPELEALYPEMTRVNPDAPAGCALCSYCASLFATERLACPSCGGPVAGFDA